MYETLVLNADGRPASLLPLSTVPWQIAIKEIWLNKVNILEVYDDWEVHSPSMTFKVPSVIMNKHFIKDTRRVKFSRNNLLLRDEYICQYCGADYRHKINELTFDHVIPRHSGGKTRWDNIVAACFSCNNEKSHHHIQPTKKPNRPTYYELASKRMRFAVYIPHDKWKNYLEWPEELIELIHQNNFDKKIYSCHDNTRMVEYPTPLF